MDVEKKYQGYEDLDDLGRSIACIGAYETQSKRQESEVKRISPLLPSVRHLEAVVRKDTAAL